MNLAIGPKTNLPSWKWIGQDLAREYKATTFGVRIPSDHDCYLFVKTLPTAKQLEKAKGRKVYMPVDYFDSEQHIYQSAGILERFDLVLSHSARLVPILGQYVTTQCINHHAKFTIPKQPYKSDGYALWIGGYQYAPYLVPWLQRSLLPVRLCTDYKNPMAAKAAKLTANRLGVSLAGLDMVEWSEENQAAMMAECKAGIDIKGDTFNQQHKPPTKAQQFILSGIPLALNASESREWCSGIGLDVPAPDDSRWLSEAYHAEVSRAADRVDLSLAAITSELASVWNVSRNPTGLAGWDTIRPVFTNTV